MVAERNPDFSIYGKTGWAASAEPQVGWYVGYLETHDDVWFFALNMDIRSETDLPLRKQLVRGTCCERHNQAGWDKTGKIEGCPDDALRMAVRLTEQGFPVAWKKKAGRG